jgi:dynein heavy chain
MLLLLLQMAGCLADAKPREMAVRMPMIHFRPAEAYVPSAEDYSCPLYKTSVRAGVSKLRDACLSQHTLSVQAMHSLNSGCAISAVQVLSTTGQSTNFVLYLSLPLPNGSDPGRWVLQGVAALCALDDE